MNELTHDLATLSGSAISLTFRNSMLGEIRFRMFSRYADEADWPDWNIRSDFAYLLAYLGDAAGAEWLNVPTNATLEDFNTAYYDFMADVEDIETFHKAVRVVNRLKARPTRSKNRTRR